MSVLNRLSDEKTIHAKWCYDVQRLRIRADEYEIKRIEEEIANLERSKSEGTAGSEAQVR